MPEVRLSCYCILMPIRQRTVYFPAFQNAVSNQACISVLAVYVFDMLSLRKVVSAFKSFLSSKVSDSIDRLRDIRFLKVHNMNFS